MRWYVGKNPPGVASIPGGRWTPFRSATAPTAASHGDKYMAVWGPFTTRRGAEWAAFTYDRGYVTVGEVERAAKLAGE